MKHQSDNALTFEIKSKQGRDYNFLKVISFVFNHNPGCLYNVSDPIAQATSKMQVQHPQTSTRSKNARYCCKAWENTARSTTAKCFVKMNLAWFIFLFMHFMPGMLLPSLLAWKHLQAPQTSNDFPNLSLWPFENLQTLIKRRTQDNGLEAGIRCKNCSYNKNCQNWRFFWINKLS